MVILVKAHCICVYIWVIRIHTVLLEHRGHYPEFTTTLGKQKRRIFFRPELYKSNRKDDREVTK